MPGIEWIVVLLLVALGWFWLASLKVRDAAMKAARAACESESLLLLDDTVAIRAIRTARDEQGHVRLQRTYDFEYSDTGDNRRKGSVVMLGTQVVLFNVGVREPGIVRAFPGER